MMRRIATLCWYLSGVLAVTTGAAYGQDDTVSVTTRNIEDVLIEVSYDTPASVISLNNSQLSSEISAPVAKIHADVGDVVAAGALLVSLDDTDARLSVRQARANLARTDAEVVLAQARLDRGRQLADENFLSVDELAALNTEVAMLKARASAERVSIEIAEEQLSDTRIVAPFAGVVSARQAQLGSLVQAGGPVMALVQLDAIELVTRVSARQGQALMAGNDPVFVAGRNSWPASALRASPILDAQNRLQEVRLAFDGDPPMVGLTGRLRWRSAARFVPVEYIQQRGTQLGIFVVEGAIARFVGLPFAIEGQPAEVELPPDAVIVERGREKLTDGSPIRIVAQ
ncbi:MAG: efflux RND transporter periplasmic adaptor subunit [Pseudomonadota bacterium]